MSHDLPTLLRDRLTEAAQTLPSRPVPLEPLRRRYHTAAWRTRVGVAGSAGTALALAAVAGPAALDSFRGGSGAANRPGASPVVVGASEQVPDRRVVTLDGYRFTLPTGFHLVSSTSGAAQDPFTGRPDPARGRVSILSAEGPAASGTGLPRQITVVIYRGAIGSAGGGADSRFGTGSTTTHVEVAGHDVLVNVVDPSSPGTVTEYKIPAAMVGRIPPGTHCQTLGKPAQTVCRLTPAQARTILSEVLAPEPSVSLLVQATPEVRISVTSSGIPEQTTLELLREALPG